MAYKLFYAKQSASMGVRVILEEIGTPYELIQSTTDRSVQRPPEQMAVNPNGWVPVLTWPIFNILCKKAFANKRVGIRVAPQAGAGAVRAADFRRV